MPVRVLYHFDVLPGSQPEFIDAYQQIVKAHALEGGALESMLLQDPEDATKFVALSRWTSRQAWLDGRHDGANPEAYKVFRDVATVVSKVCLDEVVAIS